MELNRSQNPLLLGFITFSLLLHLLLIYLLPQRSLFTAPASEEPVYVEVRPPQLQERELDLPVPEKEIPRETPAKRLGPADQVVKKETAPKGEAPEDRTPVAVRPPPHPAKPRHQSKPAPPPKPAEPVVQRQPAREAPRPPASAPEAVEAPKPLPDMRTLMAATNLAAQNIAEKQIDEWRRKYRADVEEGDAVWLDTEKDLLISFFQRFRNNIYGVWNYPPRSAERGEEGTCLLKITVNRDGTVDKVQLMESSGHRALDDQAIAAVHKGASYGPISKHYKEETLTLFAFFEYTLSRRVIY
jgi:protein TonB